MEDEEQVLDNELGAEDEQENSDSGSDDSAPPKEEGSADKSEQRINDLMGKWQKEEAARKKAEAELAALRSGQSGAQQGEGAGDVNTGGDEFLQFARQQTRESLFNSEPRLAKYGFSADDIAGDSLTEMKASFTAHVKRINGMESLVRREILTQHGLDPEVSVSGGGTEKGTDFATMSDEDFEKFLKKRDSLVR